MTREINAECRFCGQSVFVEVTDTDITLARTQVNFRDMEEKKIIATLAGVKAIKQCSCEASSKFKKQEIRRNFEGFVGGDLVNFMEANKLEEIQIIDPYGNKAKLKKKENGIIEVLKTLKDVM